MDEDVKVLYLGAVDAAQVRAARNGGEEAQIEFGVATRACDSETFVVSAQGDVDRVTAPELEAELFEAVQLGARRVVVDLTETTFFDSSAIHALVRTGERLQASGLQLGVVCGNPNIKKVLEITGVDQTLQIHATIEQAISLTPSATGIEIAGNGGTARKAAGALASLAQHLRQTALQLGAGPRFRAPDTLSAEHEGRSPA